MNDIYYTVAHRSQEEISSFKTRYQDFNQEVIPQIFKRDLGLTVTDWRQSDSWGSSHVIYYVSTKEKNKELVFRANLGVNPEPESVMLAEKLITDQVAEIGVPTNRVLEVNISRDKVDFDYQIQEKIVGQDLEDHFDGSKEEYDQLSYDLGALIARLAELEYEGFGKFDPEVVLSGQLKGTKLSFYDYLVTCLESDLKYLLQVELLSSQQLKQVEQTFEQHRELVDLETGSLIHHDLADHNIMFADNKITALFDWEAAVIGDSALDLASCPTWRTHYPREKQLLAGYESVKSLPENYQAKRDLYVLRTMLWKMVYAIRMDIVTPERAQRFKDALQPFGI